MGDFFQQHLPAAIAKSRRSGYPTLLSPKKERATRDGGMPVILKTEADNFAVNQRGWTMPIAGEFDVAEKAIRDDSALIANLADNYRKGTDAFRGAIKNDVASIGAASSKLRNEVEGVVKTFNHLMASWGSPEMKAAMENAERMAIALASISKLQNSSVTFAVIDRKPETTNGVNQPCG